MSVTAYVLLEAEPGKVKELVTEVAKIKGVDCACGVTGPYDVILYVESKDMDALGDLVTKKIQTLKGVRKTMTCLCTFCSAK